MLDYDYCTPHLGLICTEHVRGHGPRLRAPEQVQREEKRGDAAEEAQEYAGLRVSDPLLLRQCHQQQILQHYCS